MEIPLSMFFLSEKAKDWNASGESVTYVFVDADEAKNNAISRIYGFASINALGLLFDNGGRNEYLSCAEIRLFAIARQLRKNHDHTIEWSNILFKTLLQELYSMSTRTIGFKAIFLNANREGYQLYKDNGFEVISEFIAPENDSKIEFEDCTPLLLKINSEIVDKIFFDV